MSIFCVIIRNAVSSWSTCADWLWAIRPHLYPAMGYKIWCAWETSLSRLLSLTVLCPTDGTQVNNQAVKPNYLFLKVPYR